MYSSERIKALRQELNKVLDEIEHLHSEVQQEPVFYNPLQEQRAESQMTLGGLINRLEELDPDLEMEGIHEPHSYRGYYVDLAFERCEKRKVSTVLGQVKYCAGHTFEGYKGGEYVMMYFTPVWIAEYGCEGVKIMGITDDGRFITEKDEP